MESALGQSQNSIAELPILNLPGTPANIARFGSPSDRRSEVTLRYYFYPTWRSQLSSLIWFVLTGFAAVLISDAVPEIVIKGELFKTGGGTWYLHLPLLAFVPGFFLGKMFLRIFDSQYIVDARGVEAQIGLVSLRLRQPRLRFEDIRGVEPGQTIWQRLLGIGDVAIGSAMTDGVEILMKGVSSPREIQLFISGEMEKRVRSLTQSGTSGGNTYVAAVRGD